MTRKKMKKERQKRNESERKLANDDVDDVVNQTVDLFFTKNTKRKKQCGGVCVRKIIWQSQKKKTSSEDLSLTADQFVVDKQDERIYNKYLAIFSFLFLSSSSKWHSRSFKAVVLFLYGVLFWYNYTRATSLPKQI